MNAISEREFNLLSDAVRRRQRATTDLEAAQVLERHVIRSMSYLDDLAEGESVNALDYQIARAAMILHDVAATKVRAHANAEASAALAGEMLCSIGADDLIPAVARAITLHQSEDADSCAELLVHDACLLARMELLPVPELAAGALELRTASARRIAETFTGTMLRETATT
ncbi:MAG: hypothetical protein ACYDCC_11950 [Actinomycetota bacterium]